MSPFMGLGCEIPARHELLDGASPTEASAIATTSVAWEALGVGRLRDRGPRWSVELSHGE